MKLIKVILAVFVLLVLYGCNTSASLNEPKIYQSTNQFTVNKDKSNIYIYRSEGIVQSQKMSLYFNSKYLGDTLGKTYYKVTVNPGKHSIVSLAENPTSLTLDTEPGKNYFIWQEVKFGMRDSRSTLHLVTKEQGKSDVQKCSLITN